MRTTFPFSSFAVKGLELIHPVAPDRPYSGELPTMLCVSCALAGVPTIPQLNTPAMAPRIDRRPSFQREPARIDSISFHRQLYTLTVACASQAHRLTASRRSGRPLGTGQLNRHHRPFRIERPLLSGEGRGRAADGPYLNMRWRLADQRRHQSCDSTEIDLDLIVNRLSRRAGQR